MKKIYAAILILTLSSASVAFAGAGDTSFTNLTNVKTSSQNPEVFVNFEGMGEMSSLSEEELELTGAGWKTVWKLVKVGGKWAWRAYQIWSLTK